MTYLDVPNHKGIGRSGVLPDRPENSMKTQGVLTTPRIVHCRLESTNTTVLNGPPTQPAPVPGQHKASPDMGQYGTLPCAAQASARMVVSEMQQIKRARSVPTEVACGNHAANAAKYPCLASTSRHLHQRRL